MCLQELMSSLLQLNHEVQDYREYDEGNERDGNIHKGKSKCFNEGVVECCLFMAGDDWTLVEESRDFSHAAESGEQESTRSESLSI